MSHSATIAYVEEALRRLLDPTTSPNEKYELEQQLTQFKENPATCLPVLYQLLSTSSNEYALWFASSTLDEYIAKKWDQFPLVQRQHLRQFVWDLLLTSTEASVRVSQLAFVYRKLRKVIADIARIEWNSIPTNHWPEFMSQVEALIIEPSTRVIGLELLCVVTEEFGRDSASVLASIKSHAKTQLSAQLPSLLTLLSNILRGCHHQLQERVNIVEQDQIAQLALDTLNHLIQSSPITEHMNGSWIALLFELSLNWQYVHVSQIPLSPRSSTSSTEPHPHHICGSSVAALNCLTELITKPFGPQVIPEVVAQVLISLCPLIQKTVEPNGLMLVTEEYLDKLSEFVEVFLTQHLKRLEQAQYESMLPTFLELVLELTTKQPHVDGFLNCLNVWEVFVSYVEEAEQSESYDDRVRQVLSAYEQGLVGVMLHLVDRIRYATNRDQLEELNDEEKENASNNGNEQNTTGSMMNDLLMDEISILATGTLQDLAAHATATSNGTVSNAATAGGGAGIELSELKQFQVDCIALIRRIAAFPSCAPPLLERILPLVKENCENFFFHLHERPAFLPQSDPWQKEVYAVRDLTTECAILSSVAAQFYTNSTMNTKEQERIVAAAEGGWQVLHLFVTLGDYIVQNRLHTRGEVFVSIQCESITCIRYCLSCIPFLLGVESSIKQQVFNAIETIVTILLKTLDTTIIPSPQIVMHNSMQLLASLGFVLNYNDLIAIPSMALLEKNIHLFSQHLPLTIQAELYTSMSNSILNAAISFRKTTSDDSQQQQLVAVVSMARWSEAYGALILPIGEAIVQTALTIQQNPHRLLEQVLLTQLQRDCMITRFLARSIETKPKIAKDAFMTAYGPILPSLMTLFKSYLQSIKTIGERFSPSSSTSSTSSSSSSSTCTTGMKTQFKHAFKIIHEIIRLYGQLLQSIRKEMKKEQVTEIMETFINLFADIQFTSILNMQGTSTNANKNTDGVLVLCGFLNLVRIVMEEPTSMFTCFVPNVLDLCFGPLKEMIFFHSESDAVLLSSFVALVEQILDKHYRFFVVTSMDSNGQRERAYASEKAHTYFLNVFESLASVLTQPSLPPPPPFVCRQVFQLLDRIDQTQALFSFYGFQKELWMGYITTFLKLLISNERNLLKEEMGNLLYRLARVNFDQFYQNALPFFLKQVLTSKQLEKATNKEQECLKWTGQTDLPTFLKELDAFLNDLNILLH